jgi:uncharacterized protein (DUF1800 family)
MRRPAVGPRAPASPPVPPPLAVRAYAKAGFGPGPGDVEAFQALAGNDADRLTAWVDQQLSPAAIPDAACDAKLAAAGFTTLGKSLAQLFQDHHVADPPDWYDRIRPAIETEIATWIRAVHSRRQLFELLADFWHNHFNVYGWEFIEAPVWVHYDRDVIRANALGNFRQMLEAVAKAPAMLVYLDNFTNFADGGVGYGNENFPRELIELHGMGAEASYGAIPRDQVPGWPNPVGYCQADVEDMARALSGWTFDIDYVSWLWDDGGNSGLFVHADQHPGGAGLHSTEAKILFGAAMPAGRTSSVDGAQALDLLAQHPATGRNLAKKLCRRLIGDFAPATVVDSAAALFTAQWQAPDQIRQVVRHILLSDEFLAAWGEKVKRPFEIAASALRAAGGSFPFSMSATWEDDNNVFHWLYEAGGQALFGWHPPNGHPDIRGAWQSANPRVALWRLVNWLIESDDTGADRYFDIVNSTLSTPARSATEIVDLWIDRVYHRELPAADRQELIDLMAQGHNPTLALPLGLNDWPEYTQDRLRALVGVMFMSPEFLWR